jgi:hypothetical protein
MGEWRTLKEISLLLRNLTFEYSVRHVIDKLDISALQITCVN